MFGLNTTPQGGAYTTKIGLGDIDGTLTPDNLGIRVADRQVAQFNPAAITGAIGDMGQAQRLLALQQVEESDAMAKNTRLRILGSLAPQAIQAATGISMQSAQQSRNRVQQLVDQFLPQVAQQRREAFKAAQLAPLQAAMEAAKVAGDAQRSNMQNQATVYNQMATSSEALQGQHLNRQTQEMTQTMQMLKAFPNADDNFFLERGVTPELLKTARDTHAQEVAWKNTDVNSRAMNAANSRRSSDDYRYSQASGRVGQAHLIYSNAKTATDRKMTNFFALPKNLPASGPISSEFRGKSSSEIAAILDDPRNFNIRNRAIEAYKAKNKNDTEFIDSIEALETQRGQLIRNSAGHSVQDMAADLGVDPRELVDIMDPKGAVERHADTDNAVTAYGNAFSTFLEAQKNNNP